LERGNKTENYVLPAATSLHHNIIREMVALHLKEQNSEEPIELAPLNFNFYEGKFVVEDVNPMLIAVEFALQGKTILIESSGSHDLQLSGKCIEIVSQRMLDMGVPGDRISIREYTEQLSLNSHAGPTQKNQFVSFKAL
jgi:hypothetical protein